MYRLKRNPTQLFVRDSHPELPLDPDVARPGAYRWPPHFTLSFELLVFAGGSLGAACRYGLGLVLPVSHGWPLPTFTVNLGGAFLLGLLLEALVRRGEDVGLRRLLRLGIGTGFMGAFTTYSTFALEINSLCRGGEAWRAVLYAAVTVGAGLLASWLGIQVAAVHHRRTRRRP